MGEEIRVTIKKCWKPIIWVDTSVLINITKHRLGKCSKKQDLTREANLFSAIEKAVIAGKIMCPQGDQQEELTRAFGDVLDTQLRLSRGIRFLLHSDIKDIQMQAAMRTKVNGSQQLVVHCRDALDQESVRNANSSTQFIVGVYGNKTKAIVQREKRQKKLYLDEFADLKKSRQSSEITFREQYEVELTGDYQATLTTLDNMHRFMRQNRLPTEKECSQFRCIDNQVRLWDHLGGKPEGIEGLLQFFQSPEWKSTPINVVTAHLFAHLVTHQGSIKPGDPKDIEHLSVALTYSDYVVCDKAMRNVIKDLKLDRKQNVKVYSITDADALTAEILGL